MDLVSLLILTPTILYLWYIILYADVTKFYKDRIWYVCFTSLLTGFWSTIIFKFLVSSDHIQLFSMLIVNITTFAYFINEIIIYRFWKGRFKF